MILALLFSVFTGCKKETAVVDSPGGLVFRDAPSANSKRIYSLINNTGVVVLENGPRETIGGKTGIWQKVRVGSDEGWVFGGYLSGKVPEGRRTEYLFSAEGNSTAVIYLSLYKNKSFDLYFESMLDGGEKYTVIKGKWNKQGNDIVLKFDAAQPGCPECAVKYFFVNSDGRKWDSAVRIIDDNTYSFDKSVGGIALWGVTCMKYEF
ncbi:MAG: SH3 domain-containing protein [Spirochaetes bacterium]|jgi:hypothetical protein|nr:SH3 domain-containing protein [Spirochaetota bacterium]